MPYRMIPQGNKKQLVSFIAYCLDHPNERFWQALVNWSGHSFIYAQKEGEYLVRAEDSKGNKIKVFDIYNE